MDVSWFGLTFWGSEKILLWCGARWHQFTTGPMFPSVITGPSAQVQHIHPSNWRLDDPHPPFFQGVDCGLIYREPLPHSDSDLFFYIQREKNLADVLQIFRRRCCGTSPMPLPWLLMPWPAEPLIVAGLQAMVRSIFVQWQRWNDKCQPRINRPWFINPGWTLEPTRLYKTENAIPVNLLSPRFFRIFLSYVFIMQLIGMIGMKERC